jgi:hypothetical protein
LNIVAFRLLFGFSTTTTGTFGLKTPFPTIPFFGLDPGEPLLLKPNE